MTRAPGRAQWTAIISAALIAGALSSGTPTLAAQPVAGAARSCGGIHAAGLMGSIAVPVYGSPSCSEARNVIHTIYNEAGQNHTVHGWHCQGPSAGGAVCHKGSARITGG